MKKKDIKKLALLGVMGGLLMTSGAYADEQNEENTTKGDSIENLLAKNCGSGKCGSGNGTGGGTGHKCGSGKCSTPSGTNTGTGHSCTSHNCTGGCHGKSGNPTASRDNYTTDATKTSNTGVGVGSILSETEVRAQLSDEDKKAFDALSPEGKRLVIKLASQNQSRMK